MKLMLDLKPSLLEELPPPGARSVEVRVEGLLECEEVEAEEDVAEERLFRLLEEILEDETIYPPQEMFDDGSLEFITDLGGDFATKYADGFVEAKG